MQQCKESSSSSVAIHLQSAWLGSLSLSVSLLISPLTIGVCFRKSTRLTAVMGGLVTALGCLFTSFASQFHQLFLSYGIMIGIGIGMVKDPTTIMVGQYFKRRRAFVEIVVVSGSGLGISVMSAFMYLGVSNLGWRHGLQAVTGLIFLTFFLGTFYRSASLYHPQRRAILHLKSQKRKIKSKDKEKNKAQDDWPPYFDFMTLKSRTVQILFCSIAISSLGLNVPMFYIAEQAVEEGSQGNLLMALHIYIGIAWSLGCLLCGVLVVNNSSECQISRQYICQASLFLCGISIVGFAAVQGYRGYVVFAWTYGIFLGGYNYSLRMYLYEKVKARNFSRAWGFAQLSMALPNMVGIPLAGYLNHYLGFNAGFYLSAVFVILGSLSMIMINVHRKSLHRRNHKKLREKKKQLDQKHSSHNLVGINGTANFLLGDMLHLASIGIQDPELSSRVTSHIRRSGGEDGGGGLGLSSTNNLQRLQDDDDDGLVINLNHGGLLPVELSLFSEEGIADMDLPDHLFMEELEFLDNITSCNKVENCVMLSEYEQNLIKETENPSPGYGGRRGRGMYWHPSSFFAGSASSSAGGAPAEMRRTLGVGGLRQSSFTSDERLPLAMTSQRRRQYGGNNNNSREIPVFANTAAWSAAASAAAAGGGGRSGALTGNKRSITVIDEASV